MINSNDSAMVYAKYFIFAINFVIWVLGIGLLWTSIWIRSDDGLFEYNQNLDLEHYYTSCYLGMAVGSLLLIIGFLGCLGAALESPCLLIFVSLIHIFCIILEFAICGLVWRVPGGDRLQRILEVQIREHMEVRNEKDQSRRFLDLIQLKLECCGAYAFIDYKQMGQDIPASCNSDRTNNIHIRSCAENLRRFLEVRGGVIGGTALAIVLVQLFMLLFNLCLFYGLRIEERHNKAIMRHNR
ncbi:CD9 antigen-like protein [Dinothrombium tinctorium]|uniref:Tetraspanin n=1 Tax=Dinothrombium tinctorium TaxID=1965070 RepID=A0A3S3RZ56_9ACAR|nr:CD9 antigen-like protein [Dinothrombium tinctorium]RWS08172.1 CD9 antigen-like protein [Dinothrombium tinctorium]